MRDVTNKIFEAVDEGLLSWEVVAQCALKYMSEDEVKNMAKANELLELLNIDDEGN